MLGLSCRIYLGTESQKLLLPAEWQEQVQPTRGLRSLAGPHTASYLPHGPSPCPLWVQAAVAGPQVQTVWIWMKELSKGLEATRASS